MDWELAALLMLGGVTALILIGPPVAFCFLAINLVGAWLFLGGEFGLQQLIRNGISSLTNFSLTPVPFFILMGEILFRSGLAARAIAAVDRVITAVPGRLAVVAIVAGTIFSAISGSTIATTAMLGGLLLPQMLARGYHPRMAMGPIMAVGGIDMLVPPSALAVLLGSLAQISISGLLVGGIVPGLVMAVLFLGWIVFRASMDPSLAPRDDGPQEPFSFKPLLIHVLPLVAIFAAVVGAMVGGVATPTEAGAVGAFATLVVAFLYRSLSMKALVEALGGTVAVSGSVLFILLGAVTFSQVLTFSGAGDGIVQILRAADLGPVGMVLLMMGVLLVLGCFLDQVSIMMMTLPFFVPVATALNLDMVWFGVLFLICMQIGLLTPPFGLLLFVMKSAAPPDTPMREVYMAAAPYVAFSTLVLLLVFLFPPLATWLPRWLG
ncbi:TRAP transporter large permease subunit [Roseomonas sp. CCTCC AB2023176]|uniref:TRAP transporter large permease n=1 Tax=Roseomonas sp. CCTCC AB2023176 TaxID=3342640 RepID=UPI0035E353F0